MIADGFYDVPPGKVAMVVTHLQMRAKAALRACELPVGISFRAFEPDVALYRDLFDRVGAPWLWYNRRKLSDAALTQVLTDPDIALYTLEMENRTEALLELDFRQQGECELAYFGLTPALIGSGAGRYLMNRAIDLAWARPISRFHVHTCTLDSPQALGFYIRSGFAPYRQQIEIEDDPRISGLLPLDAAPHVPLIR